MELLEYLNEILGNNTLTYDNTCVVCGAGISKNSGLPLGNDIVKHIYEDFDLNKELTPFFEQYNKSIISIIYNETTPFFSQPRVEVLFDGIRQMLSTEEYNNYIFNVLLKDIENKQVKSSQTTFLLTPNYNHFLISEYIYNKGTCITFNFDELIECAYKTSYGDKLNVVSFPINQYITFEDAPKIIIKAHGTFSQETNSARNIGIDIQNLYINGFSDIENQFLSERLQNKNNIIFYGYSISDTLDFIPFLNSIFKNRKINVLYLNFDPESPSPQYRLIDFDIQKSNYFQADYFLKRIVKHFYFFDYNPDNSFANLVNLPQSTQSCVYTIDNNIISNIKSYKKEIIKLNIFKTLGLLNKFGNREMEQFNHMKKSDPNYYLYSNFDFYKKNINGLYGSNVIYSLHQFAKKINLKNYNNLFGTLNEYLFLDKTGRKTLRIFSLLVVLLMWVSLIFIGLFVRKQNPNSLIIGRNTYMPIFRLLRGMQNKNILSTLLCKCVLMQIEKSRKASIKFSNLNLYRFIEKERIEMEYFIKGKTDDIIEQLDELITKNIDTNYFIDIANLLRLKYDITKRDCDKHLCETFTSLTNDVLNKKKLSHHIIV